MLLALLFVISIVSLLWLWKRNNRQSPPGPLALPLLGNLIQLGTRPHLKLTEWAKKFGRIMTVYFGPYKVFVLTDPALVRSAFNESKFSGRFKLGLLDILYEGPYGLALREGRHAAEQRKFTVRHLREFGFGKQKMEALIMDEINELLTWFENNSGAHVHMSTKFNVVVVNALWLIVTGKRYSHDDPTLTNVFAKFREVNQTVAFSPAFFWPKLGEWFPRATNWGSILEAAEGVQTFVMSHIQDHVDNPPADGNPRDFLDAFLQEIKRTEDTRSSFHQKIGLKSLQGTVIDLLVAGSDTTSNTLSFLVLYLCKYPTVQRKLQEELDRVVGKNRQVSLADRPMLPYTQAIIHEAARITPVLPLALFHEAMEDGHIEDYFVPKGTWIVGNVYGMHRSEKIWGDPEIFRPERFLAPDGQSVTKHEAFIPFSVGKRNCIGEALAWDTMFLVTANLFQKFTFELAQKCAGVNLDHRPGIIISPEDYFVNFILRS